MPEQISLNTVVLFLLCVVFLAFSVYIRVQKRELSLKLRIVLSILAIGLAANYARTSGRIEDWWLPGLLTVFLTLSIIRVNTRPPNGN